MYLQYVPLLVYNIEVHCRRMLGLMRNYQSNNSRWRSILYLAGHACALFTVVGNHNLRDVIEMYSLEITSLQ